MLTLIVGQKGSGKTKKLVDLANEKVKISNGTVIVIEKSNKLIYDLSHDIKLVDADEFSIKNYELLFGFLSGICACNYDITDVFMDSSLKIGDQDKLDFEQFIVSCYKTFNDKNIDFIFSVSYDISEISESIKKLVTIF